jgi:hypothetical protein
MQPYHFRVADKGVGVLHLRIDLQLAFVTARYMYTTATVLDQR